MNVALSNAPTPAAAAGNAPIASGNDAASGDTPVDGASSPPAFDTVYTKHLADERSAADGKADGAKADAAADGDGKIAVATGAPSRRGAAVDPTGIDAARLAATTAQQSAATPTASSSAVSGSEALRRDKATADKDADKDTDAADGSAAQLAVISQWAYVAKPVATADAATAAATGIAGARAGFDAKAGPNTTRTSSSRDAAADDDPKLQPGITTSATPTASAKTEGTADISVVAAASAPTPDASALTATTNATVAIGSLFATRMATAESTPSPSTPATPTALREPVGSGAWSQEVGQVVLRMAANDLQSASLRLNPEHLGPLDVQVRVDNGVTHVAFDAAHADTRQALEASRTTLDQMFSSQGIKMGDVSVGNGSVDLSARGNQADGAQADASRRDGGNRWSGGDAGAGDTDRVATVSARIARPIGLVDTFA